MEARDYERVATAIRYLEAHTAVEPPLEEVARNVGLSPFHFERLFKRWAGTTPKRFVQCLRLGHAKSLLVERENLLDTAWEVGLSSSSRLHDLFCTLEAVTPGEHKRGGDGLEIQYGIHESPFGACLLAVTRRGICRLAFVDDDPEIELDALRRSWPQASISANRPATESIVSSIFAHERPETDEPFHLFVRGTNFQLQIWQALLSIPPARTVSYGAVAERLGMRGAARAVAGAIAANPIGYLIPCHRVLRSSGALSGYRWGAERKRVLIAWERARDGLGGDATRTESVAC